MTLIFGFIYYKAQTTNILHSNYIRQIVYIIACKLNLGAFVLYLHLPKMGEKSYNFQFGVGNNIWRQKKWLMEGCNLCWKGVGRTPTFGVVLKTSKKLLKNCDTLLLVKTDAMV